MSKETREFYENQPERYRIERGGAVKDLTTNLWVDALSELNPHAITPENSMTLHARKKAKEIRADRLGAIRGAGIEIPSNATDEEIVEKYGNARTAYVEHLGKLTMAAKTLRDVPTAVNRLLELDKPRDADIPGPGSPGTLAASPAALLELAARLEAEIAARVERARAIDAEPLSIEEPREE